MIIDVFLDLDSSNYLDSSEDMETYRKWAEKISRFVELEWDYPFPPQIGNHILIDDFLKIKDKDELIRIGLEEIYDNLFTITNVQFYKDRISILIENE